MKKYTVAHGHKTMNLIINLDNDEWIMDDLSATLASLGCGECLATQVAGFLADLDYVATTPTNVAENETEISFFNRADYEAFKKDPEVCVCADEELTDRPSGIK